MTYTCISDRIEAYINENFLHLYRAYLPTDGEAIVLNTDGDLFFLTKDAAVQFLMNNETPDLEGRLVTIVDLVFSIDTIRSMEFGTEHFNEDSESIGVVLDKLPMTNMKIGDYMIRNLKYEEDINEVKTITNIELERLT